MCLTTEWRYLVCALVKPAWDASLLYKQLSHLSFTTQFNTLVSHKALLDHSSLVIFYCHLPFMLKLTSSVWLLRSSCRCTIASHSTWFKQLCSCLVMMMMMWWWWGQQYLQQHLQFTSWCSFHDCDPGKQQSVGHW